MANKQVGKFSSLLGLKVLSKVLSALFLRVFVLLKKGKDGKRLSPDGGNDNFFLSLQNKDIHRPK